MIGFIKYKKTPMNSPLSPPNFGELSCSTDSGELRWASVKSDKLCRRLRRTLTNSPSVPLSSNELRYWLLRTLTNTGAGFDELQQTLPIVARLRWATTSSTKLWRTMTTSNMCSNKLRQALLYRHLTSTSSHIWLDEFHRAPMQTPMNCDEFVPTSLNSTKLQPQLQQTLTSSNKDSNEFWQAHVNHRPTPGSSNFGSDKYRRHPLLALMSPSMWPFTCSQWALLLVPTNFIRFSWAPTWIDPRHRVEKLWLWALFWLEWLIRRAPKSLTWLDSSCRLEKLRLWVLLIEFFSILSFCIQEYSNTHVSYNSIIPSKIDYPYLMILEWRLF